MVVRLLGGITGSQH